MTNAESLSLEALIKERHDLELKIKNLNEQSRSAAIAQAKKIIADCGLEPYDLFDSISIKVGPKYINPDTGELWSGRGKTPRWLIGKDKMLFEINKIDD